MSDRSMALEHVEGPRVYVPAPNHVIVRVKVTEKTRKGLFLPGGGKSDDGQGGKVPAMGEVVCEARPNGEEWRLWWEKNGPLCELGDTVLFHPMGLPIMPLHDGLFLVPIDMIYLVVRQGEDALEYAREHGDMDELLWEPEPDITEPILAVPQVSGV